MTLPASNFKQFLKSSSCKSHSMSFRSYSEE
nr:MAG TPA: hypothetical protein [Caudoviricetes sp.]